MGEEREKRTVSSLFYGQLDQGPSALWEGRKVSGFTRVSGGFIGVCETDERFGREEGLRS